VTELTIELPTTQAGPKAWAFEAYVEAQGAALQRFAYLVVGNVEDAKDATQDALLAGFRRWKSIAADPDAYLRRCVVNAGISAWRKRRRETPSADPDSGRTTAPPGVDTVWLEQMCQSLPRKQRAAIVMRFFEDRPFAEIAEVLGCSEGVARMTTHRAVATLRNTIGEEPR
jgi:RNA polymerase sigma-70 factor (sigma-E family)